MYDELVKRLRDAAKMSEALAVLLPHSEGNVTAKLYNEAADAIEVLSKRAPVPPHGRLIDADELKDVQQADADFFKGSSDYGEKCRYDEAINAVANIVNAPTIIPAEEGET